MQRLLRYLKGYLKIRVEGMYVERFLNMCSHHHIDLWNLKPIEHNYEMNISVVGFRKLKPIIRKTKSKVIILGKNGFPFYIYKYRKRTLFLLSLFASIFFLYASTFFICQIDISGNMQYSKNTIMETLNKLEIHNGIRKERIDCDEVSQFLRTEFDNITWASVYISGTKLFIEIKEKEPEEELSNLYPDNQVNHLVAESSGEITSMITRKGSPKVHIGDRVKKGDILISGEIEIKNDAGEVVAYQYVVPEAEIKIKTTVKYEDKIPLNYYKKVYTKRAVKLLRIENGTFIYDIGINQLKDNMVTSSYQKLFQIGTIKVGRIHNREYTKKLKKYTSKEYTKILNRNYEIFCEKIEKKGVQILENSVKIYSDSYCAFAKGNLCVSQTVGTIRAEEKKELKEGN